MAEIIRTVDDAARPRPDDRSRPLKILAHAISLEPLGGVEVCTLEDSLALRERGHAIDLIYGEDGALRQEYAAAGVGLWGHYDFSFTPQRAARDLAKFAAPAMWARSRKPDVLWLNRAEHIVWGQAVARAAGCALVCHLHGPPVYNRMRLLGRGVAHFVAVSDFVRDAYLAKGVPPEQITRVHNALPEHKYPVGGIPEQRAARAELGLPPDVPIVLCYGQMATPKGIPTLLEAWRTVRGTFADALLVLVDALKEPEPAISALLAELDPASYRVFPGTSDVVPWLHAADVVAFPTWLPEAFGRVVIEALSTGRPVVASKIGAVPEILSGPMERLLVHPRSSAELAAGLIDVLDWRTVQPQLGADCAAWVEQRFHFSQHVDDLERILQQSRKVRR